ncbi:hypothetical protein AB1N83_011994 [Pleurotus pulmonarius]
MAATMTSTTILSSATPTGSITSSSSSSRIVRFESECVLIPEAQHRSKRHLMATRTYSMPLWKRRSSNGFHSDTSATDDPTSPAGLSSSPEDRHIVLKLPVPSFMAKPQSPTRSPTIKPLSPCIRHTPSGRFLASPPSPIRSRRPRTPTRSPSLPLPTIHKQILVGPSSPTPTTIPLRACCPDCFHITEECMKEGDHWKEKFTRGARRRRSASLDSVGSDPCAHSVRPPTSACTNIGDVHILSGRGTSSGGFAAVTCPAKNATAVVAARFTGAGACAITVDEVDKRKRLSDVHTPPFAPTRVREASYSSMDSDSSVPSLNGDLLSDIAERKPSSSPITEMDEDDEDQLFPLPSPRRSPNASPVPGSHRSGSISGSRTPSIRSVNSTPPSPANSIPPSPNGSSSCLNKSGSCSRDSLHSSKSGSSESLSNGRSKGTRRSGQKHRCEKGFLSPRDPGERGRSRESIDREDLKSDAPTHTPSIPILGVPNPPKQRTQTNPAVEIPSNVNARDALPVFPSSVPSPSLLRSRSPTTRFQESDPTPRSQSRSKSSGSTKRSRSLSTQGGQRRRPSFSLPSPAGILTDMLKGVSSMGMGMTGTGR